MENKAQNIWVSGGLRPCVEYLIQKKGRKSEIKPENIAVVLMEDIENIAISLDDYLKYLNYLWYKNEIEQADLIKIVVQMEMAATKLSKLAIFTSK